MIRLARAWPAAAVVALACALAPAAACASSANVSLPDLFYFAVAGETNDVTVTLEGANFRITDPGAVITPMGGCMAVTIHEVTCPSAGVRAMRIGLGDMNDTATVGASVVLAGVGFGTPVQIDGDLGDDHLNGGENVANTLHGNDEFSPTAPGVDVLTGGAQRDVLGGEGGNDVLSGGEGADSLSGGPENDVINGGAGNDIFDGGLGPDGADVFNGGAGSSDSLNFFSRKGNLTVTADDLADDGESGEGDNVGSDIEQLGGGSGNDVITGGPGATSVSGGDGDDALDGAGGRDSVSGNEGRDAVGGGADDDVLNGGPGEDSLDGGDGDDRLRVSSVEDEPDVMRGGAGTDLADYSGATEPVHVSPDGNADDGVAGENDNVMPDVEDAVGGIGADTLIGSAAANQLDGGPGDDTLTGLDGADGLDGGPGADTLDGGEGIDSLAGGNEADRIRSRDSSADEVGCGSGADAVVADAADVPRADCEETSLGLVIAGGTLTLTEKGVVKLSVSCPAAEGVTCTGSATLISAQKLSAGNGKHRHRAQRLTLAVAKVSIATGTTADVKLKLSKRAEKAIGKRKTIPAVASAKMFDATDLALVTEQRVVLARRH